MNSPDHTFLPDVETASDGYARRFAGPIGEFFLDVQREAVGKVLAPTANGAKSALEIGGGHGQLTQFLLDRGYQVTVHGSNDSALARLRPLETAESNRLKLVSGDIFNLPFPDRSYDTVLAFRLLPHVVDWRAFLAEACRLSHSQVIIDVAAIFSFNVLTPLLFAAKKKIEGNTREYFCHRLGELRQEFGDLGFQVKAMQKQFFFPMGVYRKLGRREPAERLETVCKSIGLTALFGSPVVVCAERLSS